jgi:uncharacterized repeat protein (TIGR02543 family)
MASGFNLAQKLETVGDSFAAVMFACCWGDGFGVAEGFNLPQKLETVGDRFALVMFVCCWGDGFSMAPGFNLPQNLETVGDDFADGMFSECCGAVFSMAPGFNLPQNLKTVGDNFAAGMFAYCDGVGFVVNDEFVFPILPAGAGEYAFSYTFNCLGGSFVQTRTASSIIGDNSVPPNNIETFSDSGCFVDLPFIDANWGGEGRMITVVFAPGIAGTWTETDETYNGVVYSDALAFFSGDTTADHELGYTFNGWSQATINPTTDSATYTAQWTLDEFTVTFVDWDKTILASVQVGYGDSAFAPSDPDRVGYTFTGWDTDFSQVTSDLTVTATYTINVYTVVFEPGTQGTFTAQSTGNLHYGDPTPDAPVVTGNSGYTFTTWNPTLSNVVTDNVNYIAQWVYTGTSDENNEEDVEEFTVTYRGNGASGGVVPIDNNGYATGDVVVVLGQGSLVRAGYSFIGWSKSSTATFATFTAGSTFTIENDDDVVLFAVWSQNKYTITFEPGTHGTFTAQTTNDLHYGDTTPNAPTVTGETGWNFNGWSPTPSTTITGNTTYTAQWTQQTTTPTTPTPTPMPSPSVSATPAPSYSPEPTATASPSLSPLPSPSSSVSATSSPTDSPHASENDNGNIWWWVIVVVVLVAILVGFFVRFFMYKKQRKQ